MKSLYVFLISMVPLIEQRGAIPVGVILNNLNPMWVFFVSLMGSFVPAPFVYLFFNQILAWMKKVRFFDKFTNFVEKKVQNGAKSMEGKTEAALIIFVGIPLPTTGLWTGSAIASFIGMNFKKSMICIFIGGIISATIITIVSVIAPKLLGY